MYLYLELPVEVYDMVKIKRSIIGITLVIVLLLLSLTIQNSIYVKASPEEIEVLNLNKDNILKHVEYLSSLGTRVSGYNQCNLAAQYILNKLKEYGLNAWLENFTVTVPVSYGAYLKIGDRTIKAYPLAPNLVETCYVNGLSGQLEYIEVKNRDLSDFNGHEVKDRIILMDYDSGDAWRWAVYLGAKAVVFIYDPEKEVESPYRDDFFKRMWIPVDFPRILVYKEDIADLLSKIREGGVEGEIGVNMVYENRISYNVIGEIEGSDPNFKDQMLILATYYDSWSIVPDLAPGADEALGPAILLEVANEVAKKGAIRTVRFIFFSGYHQALAGVRNYVYYHKKTDLDKTVFVIEIQASTATEEIGFFDRGNYFGHLIGSAEAPRNFMENAKRGIFYRVAYDYFGVNASYVVESYNPSHASPELPRYFCIEHFTLASIPGLAIAPISLSEYRKSPYDTYDRVYRNRDKIYKIADIYATISLYYAKYCTELRLWGSALKLKRITILEGRVLLHNKTTGRYSPVPNALITFIYDPRARGIAFHYLIIKADENGHYRFVYPADSDRGAYYVTAFSDYPTEGPVDYGPDMGVYARGWRVQSVGERSYAETVVFPAGSLVVFDVLNPETLEPLGWFLGSIWIVDHETQRFADYFGLMTEMIGFCWGEKYFTGTMMFFINPKINDMKAIDISLSPPGYIWASCILTNRSRGYTIGKGQQYIETFSIIRIFENIRLLNEERYRLSRKTRLYIESVEESFKIIDEKWPKVIEALKNKDYTKARALALYAYSAERRAYVDLRYNLLDASYTSIFFLLMALPFAYLMERLLFEFEDLKKRAVAMFLIFIFSVLYMSYAHPGFCLVANVFLTALSFLMIVLTTIPLILVFNSAGGALKELRTKIVGKHFEEMDKLSAFVLSMSLGLRNLRRRKLRTTLLIISILIVTMAFVSIISVVSARYIAPVEQLELDHAHVGIMIRRSLIERALSPQVLQVIYHMYGDELEYILPVVFAYPRGLERQTGIYLGPGLRPGERVYARAIVGLSTGEWEVLRLKDYIGTMFSPDTRPFVSDTELVCIVPADLLRELGKEIGDTLDIRGYSLRIVGNLSEPSLYFNYVTDNKGEPLLPLEMEAQQREVEVRYVEPGMIIIVPSKVAEMLGGEVFAVRIVPKNKDRDTLYRIASEIAYFFEYDVTYTYFDSERGKYIAVRLAKVTAQQVLGQEVILPAAILIMIILNSVMGAVHERRTEIGIFSSVGLSPLHVAGMFLMEFIIVSVVGAYLGYMIGVLTPQFIGGLKIKAGSIWLVIAVLVSIGVTLLSTLYPVRFASKLVTPSLERKWRLERQAIRRGDTFYVKIPFVITKEYVDGALLYLAEYLDLFRSEREGAFAVDEMHYEESTEAGAPVRKLSTKVRVKPFDWGVTMRADIVVKEAGPTTTWEIICRRLTGVEHIWVRGVKNFADTIRKQLLMWRGLTPEDREDYVRRARKELERLKGKS